MSAEAEFSRWLRNPDKSLQESFQFALKAWQSAEFTLSSKYELVVEWLLEQGEAFLAADQFPYKEFAELLQLRSQPSWVSVANKVALVKMLLSVAESLKEAKSPQLPKMLQHLCEFDLLQDVYRSKFKLQAKVFGQLFKTYETYLSSLTAATFQNTEESNFMAKSLTSLKDSVKRAGDLSTYQVTYTEHVVEPLVEVLLVLEGFGLSFFDEFFSLDGQLIQDMEDSDLVNRACSSLHVRLILIESSIINRRGVLQYMSQLLSAAINDKLAIDSTSLSLAAYTLEMLHKHEINLNFVEIDTKPALDFLSDAIAALIREGKTAHLRESLMLLCSALRFNPLILEKNIFQFTTWMIVAEKNPSTQTVFEEFLVLLLDMFRRLSRSEKLVANVLKVLKEWLKENNVPEVGRKSKRKNKESEQTPLKAKRSKTEGGDSGETEEEFSNNKYVEAIFEKVYSKSKPQQETTAADPNPASSLLSICESFPLLDSMWPSSSVGLAFARLVMSLMTKPSLVIWKTLLYSLKEQLGLLQAQKVLKENDLFLVDLQAALLSEYFAGCRIAEQYNKFAAEINDLRGLSKELLAQFGQFILSQEHNQRVMHAFLECAYYAGNFELLLTYYKPDGCDEDSRGSTKVPQSFQSYLQPQEWTLIEQRVLNFGKIRCKFLLNRLILQRKKCEMLLTATEKSANQTAIKSQVNESLLLEVIRQSKSPSGFQWLLASLKHEEKLTLAAQIIEQPVEAVQQVAENLEMLELMSLGVYEKIALALGSGKHAQNSLLVALSCDYRSLLGQQKDMNAMDKYLNELVGVLNKKASEALVLKKLPKDNSVENLLELLGKLPLSQLRRQWKLLIFIQHIALHKDLTAFEELRTKSLDILTDFLHFGHKIAIFKYFSIETTLQLFPLEACWALYEFIFANIKNEDKGLDGFLTGLEEYFRKILEATTHLEDGQRRLLMLTIESLGAIVGPAAKRLKKHTTVILEMYGKFVKAHFASGKGKPEEHRQFVEETLAGFSYYAKGILDSGEEGVDENFRRICKIYIGNSMDYRNPQAVRLMQVSLTNRKQLHLDLDEIEFVLSGYWRHLLSDIRSQTVDLASAEVVVKMIIDYKTNEDFLLTMRGIGEGVGSKDFLNVVGLLRLIAKCPFSNIKGAIFNEHFKLITADIIERFNKAENSDLAIALLKAQQAIVENKMVPLSPDTLDSILSFLVDINVKKFPLLDSNLQTFNTLHQAMCDVSMAIIKHRNVLLMDRVPHFMNVFKDLLQAIVWYKSERQKSAALSTDELNDLAELAMKLEALTHVIAANGVSFKRVAPFALTFAINLMVANKRATTLYPKIKNHVEGICYDLIGICDHRVGRFILRCSNEAARQVYETLVKDHKKYHKFKGKV